MKSKRETIYLLIIIFLIALAAQFYYTYRYQPKVDDQILVYYNQDRELNKEIIQAIRDADEYVYFAVYTFTRFDIKDALLAANHRGVKIVGLVDREQTQKIEQQQKIVKELQAAGIPIYEQDHLGIMHFKTLVTEKIYASGSYNWTSAATNLNDEVLEIGKNDHVRLQYKKILEELFEEYGNQNNKITL